MPDVLTKKALMKCQAFVYVVLAWLLLVANLGAQSNDWDVLQGVPEGAKIKVTLKRRATFGHCILEEVTDDHLACYFTALGTRQYGRDEIKAVFLGRHSARMGFAVGAGTGVALGATRSCCDTNTRIVDVIILAPVLGGIGAGIGAMVDPFLDGKTIYRSPDAKPAKPRGTTQVHASTTVRGDNESRIQR